MVPFFRVLIFNTIFYIHPCESFISFSFTVNNELFFWFFFFLYFYEVVSLFSFLEKKCFIQKGGIESSGWYFVTFIFTYRRNSFFDFFLYTYDVVCPFSFLEEKFFIQKRSIESSDWYFLTFIFTYRRILFFDFFFEGLFFFLIYTIPIRSSADEIFIVIQLQFTMLFVSFFRSLR